MVQDGGGAATPDDAVAAFLAAIDGLLQGAEGGSAPYAESPYTVTKLKNRFPAEKGYMDINTNIVFSLESGQSTVCEMQFLFKVEGAGVASQ